MPQEKPGEHPLTDILVYGRETYGPDADELIRGISEFSSKYELYDWWTKEIKGITDRDEVHRKAELRFQELFQRSNMSGWGNK